MAVDRYVKLPVYDESGNLTREEIHIDPRALTRFFRDAARKHIVPNPAEEERWRDIPFKDDVRPPCDYEISRHGTIRTKTGKTVIYPQKVVWSDDLMVEIPVDECHSMLINPKNLASLVWDGKSKVSSTVDGVREGFWSPYLAAYRTAKEALAGEMSTDEYHNAETIGDRAQILLDRLLEEGWQVPKND